MHTEYLANSDCRDKLITVLRGLKFEDKYENLALTIIRDASLRTMYEVGDGTTTSAILGASIFMEAVKGDMELSELDKYLPRVVSALKEQIVPVDIRKVAMTSSNGDESIVSSVVEAYESVGNDGTVIVQEGAAPSINVRTFGGYTLDRGVASPAFLASGTRNRVDFVNPLICVFKNKVSYLRQIHDVMSLAAEANVPIVIVAPAFEDEAAKYMLVNAQANKVAVAPIICDVQESLHDLAMYCGVDLIMDVADVSLVKQVSSFYATLKEAVFTPSDTDNSRVATFVSGLQSQLDDTALSDDARELLQKRISNLLGKVAVIEVGAKTDSEAGELKDRVDDAVLAVRSAIRNGALAGGGEALRQAVNGVFPPNEEEAAHPLEVALLKPAELVGVAGASAPLDSALAVIRAAENGFSAAKILLNTRVAVVPIYDSESHGSV